MTVGQACAEAVDRRSAMALEKELSFFQSIRQRLIDERHEGKFALIKGEELIGTFDDPETAYSLAVSRFGREPFLIKQVLREEPTEQLPAVTLGVLHARL